MHETGGEGSIGWRYNWSLTEAKKNLLRTHTTAVSSRMLYALAQQKEFTPKKYFSIDRVFRNESIDATHLAEVCTPGMGMCWLTRAVECASCICVGILRDR
jgi:phenylalanyl-tRNA synthetase alpha chain